MFCFGHLSIACSVPWDYVRKLTPKVNKVEYYADLLMEEVLVVELKWVERLAKEHMAQCLNYLPVSKRVLARLFS